MKHKYDDKFVLEEYCMPSNEKNHDESCDHTNLSVPTSVPVPYPVGDESLLQKGDLRTSTHRLRCKLIPPKRIALCGGGMRAIAHIGAMKALEEEGLLRCVKEVIGISAGSLFGLLYVLGYTLVEIEKLALHLDFNCLFTADPEALFQFSLTYGIDSGQSLTKLLHSILKQKGFSPTCTFEELFKKTGMRFKCFATVLKTSQVKEFSLEKTPSIPVALACRASMSLPIIYSPVKDPLTGHFLVDGSVLHNIPIVHLPESEIQHTLTIFFQKVPYQGKETEIEDVIQMVQHLYDTSTRMRNKNVLEKYKDKIICIPIETHDEKSIGVLSFNADLENKKQLIEFARTVTMKFLTKQQPLTLLRRYSCS